MSLSALRRELFRTAVLFIIIYVFWMLPYALIATFWNGESFDSALAAYKARLSDKGLYQAIELAILVTVLRIANWFENRPREPRYSDREDGYRAGRND